MSRPFPPIFLAPVIAISLTPAGVAQQAQPKAADAAAVTVIEAGRHPLQDLIDRFATELGRNYLYSEADLQGTQATIELQSPLRLAHDEVETVLGELAYSKGFVLVPLNEEQGIYEWMSQAGPKRSEIFIHAMTLTPEQVLANPRRVIPVQSLVPLHHLNAQLAQNQLRPFFGTGAAWQGLTIGAAGESLLLGGVAPQVAKAIELVRGIDEQAANAQSQQQTWQEKIEQRLRALEKKAGVADSKDDGGEPNEKDGDNGEGGAW